VKEGVRKEDYHKIAWLLGLWIGDGSSERPEMSINRLSTDEISRIKQWSKDLNLLSNVHQSKEENKNEKLTGRIIITSNVQCLNTEKYYEKEYNIFFLENDHILFKLWLRKCERWR